MVIRDWKARPLLRSRYGGELGESGLEVFYNLSGDDVGIGEVGAVFEAFVFEPEDVEVELESPASPVAALRVARYRN